MLRNKPEVHVVTRLRPNRREDGRPVWFGREGAGGARLVEAGEDVVARGEHGGGVADHQQQPAGTAQGDAEPAPFVEEADVGPPFDGGGAGAAHHAEDHVVRLTALGAVHRYHPQPPARHQLAQAGVQIHRPRDRVHLPPPPPPPPPSLTAGQLAG